MILGGLHELAGTGARAQFTLIDKARVMAATAVRYGDEFIFAPDPDMAVAGVEDERAHLWPPSAPASGGA